MADKLIKDLDAASPLAETDLIVVADPTTGIAKKAAISALSTYVLGEAEEFDPADYATKTGTETLTGKTMSGAANTFSNISADSVIDGATNKTYTATEKTKLGAIAGTNTGDETSTTTGALINGATEKTTPVDADMVGLMDSAASNILKKLSWANIKATLKTYFDSVTTTLTNKTLTSPVISTIVNTGTLTLPTTTGTLALTSQLTDAGITTTDVTTNNFTTSKHGFVPKGTNVGKVLKDDGSWGWPQEVMAISCGDRTTACTAGTNKGRARAPYACTLDAVRADLETAPTGSTFIFDINESGTTVLSTKLSIDISEDTSFTAATPAVISDSAIANNAIITVDFDQVGSTVAGAGPTVYLYITRTS